ncbi:MAG: hypothetical protein F6K17_22525, partial [Okeania sp. SIO3C4]|nr:hypothetical protein [Okeania sp. SIO3C4]
IALPPTMPAIAPLPIPSGASIAAADAPAEMIAYVDAERRAEGRLECERYGKKSTFKQIN